MIDEKQNAGYDVDPALLVQEIMEQQTQKRSPLAGVMAQVDASF